jgi:hypothetical protein
VSDDLVIELNVRFPKNIEWTTMSVQPHYAGLTSCCRALLLVNAHQSGFKLIKAEMCLEEGEERKRMHVGVAFT